MTLALVDSLGQTGSAELLINHRTDPVTQRFRVLGDSLHFPDVDKHVSRFQATQGAWSESAVARSEIRELRTQGLMDRGERGRFIAKSILVLGSTGTLTGLIFGAGCSYTGNCSAAAITVGAGLGIAVGVMVGAVGGGGRTTIYRFRPDTPQQMSVVIGVGPTNGGAR